MTFDDDNRLATFSGQTVVHDLDGASCGVRGVGLAGCLSWADATEHCLRRDFVANLQHKLHELKPDIQLEDVRAGKVFSPYYEEFIVPALKRIEAHRSGLMRCMENPDFFLASSEGYRLEEPRSCKRIKLLRSDSRDHLLTSALMERMETKGYENYLKVFERTGKYTGGVP